MISLLIVIDSIGNEKVVSDYTVKAGNFNNIFILCACADQFLNKMFYK